MSDSRSTITENDFATMINDILNGNKSISYSSLSKFLQSPKHFKEYLTGEFEQTQAMKEGIIFHMACLEPEKFKEEYWILDDTEICQKIGGAKPRATKVYKEWLNEEMPKHNGEMISQELYDTFMNMSTSLRLNSCSGKYINNLTATEQRYESEFDGFKVVYKIDGEGKNEDGLFLCDIKKVADASFKRIKWDIKDMNYDMQGAIYSEFKNVTNYILIYIDKGCNISVVKLTKDTLNEGFSKFECAINGLTKCAKENRFNDSYDFWNNGHINF